MGGAKGGSGDGKEERAALCGIVVANKICEVVGSWFLPSGILPTSGAAVGKRGHRKGRREKTKGKKKRNEK